LQHERQRALRPPPKAERPHRPPGESPAAIRILVADDSYLAREGIARILADEEGFDIVGECGDLESLRRAVDEHTPDVVLADVRMPPTGTDEGIQIASELRASRPEIGVLVLSQIADVEYATELFKEGPDGRGYIVKDRLRHREELTHAIREIAAGSSYVDSEIVATVLAPRTTHRLDVLTAREFEILGLIAEGRSNAAIAVATNLSKRGVERHVNTIFAKLGLTEAGDANRRVMATLAFLASGSGQEEAP
jgi:DNA-binding NarL/FixJ family response regulator